MGGWQNSFTSLLTSIWFLLGYSAIMFAVNVVDLRRSLAYLNSRVATSAQRSESTRTLAYLQWWGALTTEATESEREKLIQQFEAARAHVAMGRARAELVAAIVLALMSLFTRLIGLPIPGFANALFYLYALLCIPFVGHAVGTVLGYRAGLAALKSTTGGSLADSNRAVRDYCAPRVWIVQVVVLVAAIATGLYADELSHTLTFPVLFTRGPVTASLLALVSVVCATLCAQVTAHLPNLVNAPNPFAAQRASDYFKAQLIAQLLTTQRYSNAVLIILAAMYWGDTSPQSVQLPFWLIAPIMLLGLILLVSATFTLATAESGRLGGRLTGWWWQRRPARQNQPAIEE